MRVFTSTASVRRLLAIKLALGATYLGGVVTAVACD